MGRCALGLLAMVATLACGGKPSQLEASEPSSSPTPTTTPARTTAPTDGECTQLLDHVIDLAVREQHARVRAEHAAEEQSRAEQARAEGLAPPAARPFDPSLQWSEADAAKIRASYLQEHMAACKNMPRAALECALAAGTTSALGAC